MRKRFAPLALLLGLLTALLLGSTAMAQATTLNPSFACSLTAVNVVTCNDVLNDNDINVLNDIPVTVKITENDIVDDVTVGDVGVLQNNLNNIDVDILNLTAFVQNIKAVTVSTYNSFNPPVNITVGDVKVCIPVLSSICL